MTFAIYGRSFNEDCIPAVQELFDALEEGKVNVVMHEDFKEFLTSRVNVNDEVGTFRGYEELKAKVDKLISVGGDGTLLDTISFVRDSGIPILGLNTGRLGFLAQTSKEDIRGAVDALIRDDFERDRRSLIQLDTQQDLFAETNFALNEFTVLKKDSSSMVVIHTYVDDVYLNTYWADGLIVATPTGSTAYSMSCGGPIVSPEASNFVITPVAAHNLNVRPVVVPDSSEITLKMEGREEKFLTTLDSRSRSIGAETELRIKKADFGIDLVKLKEQNFLDTLRNKLMWGLDKRN